MQPSSQSPTHSMKCFLAWGAILGIPFLFYLMLQSLGHQPYTLTDLGTLGGANSRANGLNALGQVVGQADTASNTAHAFLWEKDKITDLGTLGGENSFACDINQKGEVVGWSQLANGETHACLWKDGHCLDLGTLGGKNSFANALNEAGQIVGKAQATHFQYHAFLYDHAKMHDLGTLDGTLNGGMSEATHINERGEITGQVSTEDGAMSALRRIACLLVVAGVLILPPTLMAQQAPTCSIV